MGGVWIIYSSLRIWVLVFNLLTAHQFTIVWSCCSFLDTYLTTYLYPLTSVIPSPSSVINKSASNSPSVYQGFMNKVFQEFLHHFIIVYNDDILIYYRNQVEHR